jgi:ABC-type nitrate/sulfonate/bicarbonate transport system ATPase subunit
VYIFQGFCWCEWLNYQANRALHLNAVKYDLGKSSVLTSHIIFKLLDVVQLQSFANRVMVSTTQQQTVVNRSEILLLTEQPN